ncbi:MAG: alpha/beta hydrolase [Candidatus Rokubacteria bacterium]|nr:alpha/beta hydrolase [Candidatus Rokubacteria bacterium]
MGSLPLADVARHLTAPDGATLAYRLWRPGAPRRVLVLLHGVASNLTRWSELVAATALRDTWDLLRPDLRGNGGSVWRGRMDLDVWCADLAALLDAEGYARAVVGGHCLGANIAVEFARRCPERTAGLVLVEPMPREALVGYVKFLAARRARAPPAAARPARSRRARPRDARRAGRGPDRAARALRLAPGRSGDDADRRLAPGADGGEPGPARPRGRGGAGARAPGDGPRLHRPGDRRARPGPPAALPRREARGAALDPDGAAGGHARGDRGLVRRP